MELEPSRFPDFVPQPDRRPLIPEPLPVRLVAVDDVRLPAAASPDLEDRLDAFYVQMLGFERNTAATAKSGGEASTEGASVPAAARSGPSYRADNFSIHFDVGDAPLVRDDLRTLGIEVRSLEEAEKKLIDAELEYTRQRGVMPGQESLVLLDPAGNWVELLAMKPV